MASYVGSKEHKAKNGGADPGRAKRLDGKVKRPKKLIPTTHGGQKIEDMKGKQIADMDPDKGTDGVQHALGDGARRAIMRVKSDHPKASMVSGTKRVILVSASPCSLGTGSYQGWPIEKREIETFRLKFVGTHARNAAPGWRAKRSLTCGVVVHAKRPRSICFRGGRSFGSQRPSH